MKKKLPFGKLLSQGRLCEKALAFALEDAFDKGAPADKTLASLFRAERSMGSRDRALVSAGVFAVFRWLGWLEPLLERPFDPRVCARLLVAASAADSSEAPDVVEAWASDAGVQAGACLDAFRGSSPEARAAKALAVLGKPSKELKREALIPGWALQELAPAAASPRLFDWLQARPPIWIRAQTDDLDSLLRSLRAEGLDPVQHPFLKKAFQIKGVKVNLHALKDYSEGSFEIQDISSQCIGQACLPKPGEMWWDVCAGGGGKSLQLADLMRRKGSIRATDTRAYKLDDLKKRAARAAFPNIRAASWDGSAPDSKRQAVFDGVLVDSPCSSSGRWRRNPDARWIAKKEWIDELRDTQLKILEAAAAGVKPGGVLVYATCSMFKREDFDNVERFLSRSNGFSLEPFPNPLTGETTDGTLLTLPWDADCDASFVARFRKSKQPLP